MADTQLYPNGGTPPTTFTEVGPPAPALPKTGSNETGDYIWAGGITLVLGVLLVIINKQFFRRKPRKLTEQEKWSYGSGPGTLSGDDDL